MASRAFTGVGSGSKSNRALKAGVAAAVAAMALAPAAAEACACGCGVFDIGAENLFPKGSGDVAFIGVDYMDQSQNWSGPAKAPASGNEDKEIRTTFVNLGLTHMFNRRWGLVVDAPIGTRAFRTDAGSGVETHRDSGLGDMKITGVWTGLSPDMSVGLTFGLKLPTGHWRTAGFDRDTQLGAGATDLLLGGYKLGYFGSKSPFGWFARAIWDQPFAYNGGYRPGAELDTTLGVYHSGWQAGPLRIKPMVQLIGSVRGRDRGSDAMPGVTGYKRMVVSPGLELQTKAWRLNADLGLPAYQRVNGDQLVAPQLMKAVLSRSF